MFFFTMTDMLNNYIFRPFSDLHSKAEIQLGFQIEAFTSSSFFSPSVNMNASNLMEMLELAPIKTLL